METNPHAQAWSLLFHHFGFGHEYNGVSRELASPKETLASQSLELGFAQVTGRAGCCWLSPSASVYWPVQRACCCSHPHCKTRLHCLVSLSVSFLLSTGGLEKRVPVLDLSASSHSNREWWGEPSRRQQAPLCHRCVACSWALCPSGSSFSIKTGRTHPSLQVAVEVRKAMYWGVL